jgi:hypothetical protein
MKGKEVVSCCRGFSGNTERGRRGAVQWEGVVALCVSMWECMQCDAMQWEDVSSDLYGCQQMMIETALITNMYTIQ